MTRPRKSGSVGDILKRAIWVDGLGSGFVLGFFNSFK